MKFLVLALLVSCGASSAEVKTARDAKYKGAPATLFATMKAATEATYKILGSDEATLVLKTEPRWYTPEGQADTARGGNVARLQDNSINLSFVVALVTDDDTYRVNVEPIILRHSTLTANPEKLQLGNPLVPGWVNGKVESLQLDLYGRLKGYAVTTGAPAPAK